MHRTAFTQQDDEEVSETKGGKWQSDWYAVLIAHDTLAFDQIEERQRDNTPG